MMDNRAEWRPADAARQAFERAFGAAPHGLVKAPGRVNLIGEHTDYNGGFVLPCALDFHTAVAWSPASEPRVRMVAHGFGDEVVQVDLSQPLQCGNPVQWSDYVRAMLWVWQASGRVLPGLDLAVAGNVPVGAGLSSSAALQVALALMLTQARGPSEAPPTLTEMALMAQQAENDFVGCRCGNMDQLISAHGKAGHALLIDCRSLETRAVAMPEDLTVVVIDSKVQRGLVDSEYNLRRQQCEAAARHLGVASLRDASLEDLERRRGGLDPVAWRRARHVISENNRTVAAAKALAAGDGASMGRLMAQSHQSMRDDFEITVPPIDRIVDLVGQEIGPLGGVRMTGGGFGGCVVALVPQSRVERVKARLAADYQAPCGKPAAVYACSAAAGATVMV